ncbi:hypothetical protein JCM10450v2_006271 [Rhodotorula kratochvilovae]
MAPTLADVDVLPAQPRLHGSSSDTSIAKKDNYGSKSEETSLYDGHNELALAPRPPPVTAGDALLRFFRLRKQHPKPDPDAIATVESVFDGPHADEYAPHPQWENLPNFDPSFRWTYAEEKKVVRKCNIWIFGVAVLMFFALDIDRGNMSNATADNLLKDLKLTQADYNLGNLLSKLGFLIAELPSQMIGKKIGVDIWLPIQVCVFSVLSAAQFGMNGRASFLALRFLIAFFQGGFIPDVILYLSYYFTNAEIPIRIAIFFTTNFWTNTVTGFAAVGLLKMRGTLGWEGWRWMFLIEGLFTLVIGIASFFLLAPSPSQTKTSWRPNGIFTDREAKIAVMRVIRDEPQKATMHNRQPLTFKLLWKSAKDYDLWPMYLLGLIFSVPGVPIGFYLQLSLKQLGFSTVMANLLSVPYTVLGVVLLLAIVALSELINSRTWVAIIQNVWYLPLFFALRFLPNPIAPWTYWALASLVLAAPYAHGLQVSWVSRNSGSVRTRTFSASVYNMACQTANIIGSQIYQASDAPRYFKGNTVLLAIACFNVFILYPFIFWYYGARNAYKERKWNAMTVQEQKTYLATTSDEGTRRLDFRFIR